LTSQAGKKKEEEEVSRGKKKKAETTPANWEKGNLSPNPNK